MTTKTLPDTEELKDEAENKVFTMLKSEKKVSNLAEELSEKLKTTIKLGNPKLGSITVDMIIEYLSQLEYIKYLSDNWVLSNMVDGILMTPEFISTCQAEDVALDVVVDEESYKEIKRVSGK